MWRITTRNDFNCRRIEAYADRRNRKYQETKASTESKKETQETEPSNSDKTNAVEDHLELLTAYGEAYANFSSIDHRNRKLKELMTEECIQLNGIDVEKGIMLESSGKIVSIFQNEKEEAAVLLE